MHTLKYKASVGFNRRRLILLYHKHKDQSAQRRHERRDGHSCAVSDEGDKGEGNTVVVELSWPHDARQSARGGKERAEVGANDARI